MRHRGPAAQPGPFGPARGSRPRRSRGAPRTLRARPRPAGARCSRPRPARRRRPTLLEVVGPRVGRQSPGADSGPDHGRRPGQQVGRPDQELGAAPLLGGPRAVRRAGDGVEQTDRIVLQMVVGLRGTQHVRRGTVHAAPHLAERRDLGAQLVHRRSGPGRVARHVLAGVEERPRGVVHLPARLIELGGRPGNDEPLAQPTLFAHRGDQVDAALGERGQRGGPLLLVPGRRHEVEPEAEATQEQQQAGHQPDDQHSGPQRADAAGVPRRVLHSVPRFVRAGSGEPPRVPARTSVVGGGVGEM